MEAGADVNIQNCMALYGFFNFARQIPAICDRKAAHIGVVWEVPEKTRFAGNWGDDAEGRHYEEKLRGYYN